MTPDSPLGPSNLKCSQLHIAMRADRQDPVRQGQDNPPLVGPAGLGSWDSAEKGREGKGQALVSKPG